MDGAFMHWHTDYDLQRLREFLVDVRDNNPYKALRWRAKENELSEKLSKAQPYGCHFYVVHIWLPKQWIEIILEKY